MKIKLIKRPALLWQNGMVVGLASLLIAGSVMVAPAPKANAAGCRDVSITSWDPSEFSQTQSSAGYYYTKALWVPYWSGCGDINIDKRYMVIPKHEPTHWPMFRVRYYPSSGAPSQTSGWVTIDPNSSNFRDDPYNSNLVIMGYNVLNGTKYRIEVNQPVSFHIWD